MNIIAIDGIKLFRCNNEDAFEIRIADGARTRRVRFMVDAAITSKPGEPPPPDAQPLAEFMGRIITALEATS